MAWYNIFKKASDISKLETELDFARRQLEFAQGRIDLAETKVDLLEKSIKSERDKRDKFVYIAMDRLVTKGGQYAGFEKALVPEKEPPLLPLSDDMEMRITATAKLNLESDIEAGFDPQPIEFYEKIIRDDPEQYLPQ